MLFKYNPSIIRYDISICLLSFMALTDDDDSCFTANVVHMVG